MKLLVYVIVDLYHWLYTKGSVKQIPFPSNSSILAHFTLNLCKYCNIEIKVWTKVQNWKVKSLRTSLGTCWKLKTFQEFQAFLQKLFFWIFRSPFEGYLNSNFKNTEDKSMKFCTKIAQSIILTL